MSKSITEKELAENLAGIYGDINDYDWPTVARTAAELLGVTLTPEKPEPGTWWIVADGPNAGKVARANEYAGLSLYGDEGQMWSYTDCDTWPDLTPARVVAAEPVELGEEEVGELFDTARGDHWLSWDSWTDTPQGIITATVNAARRKLLEASK